MRTPWQALRSGAVTQWMAAHPIATYVIIILLVVVPGFVRTEQLASNDRELIDCIAEWGDEFTHRSDELTRLAAERTEALDRMIRDLALQDDQARSTEFRRHLTEYIAASDEYVEAAANNPVPEPPQLRCNGR